VDIITSKDDQYAAFASVDVKPTDKLTLTAALRYTKVDFTFDETKDGPTNGGSRTQVITKTSEGAWTPKFAAKYQVDDNAMLYASASKGFRPAGAQPSTLPERCASDLTALGLTTSTVPTSFESDSLWSYEAGTKGACSAARWRSMSAAISSTGRTSSRRCASTAASRMCRTWAMPMARAWNSRSTCARSPGSRWVATSAIPTCTMPMT
jgi:outer membrane receptor for monomeric catechols